MAVSIQAPVSSIEADTYEPFPLEGILEGDPKAEVHWLRADAQGEDVLYAGLFRAQPSKWPYVFAGHETFHVLEGEVRIELEDGVAVDLRPGNIASFPKGAKSTWTIKEPFKKFFVINS